MPMFSFECTLCKCTFEQFLVSWKDPNPPCPKCNIQSDRCLSKPIMKCSDGPRAKNRETTPISTDGGGVLAGFAHLADRNTGKSLGYTPAGVIDES